MGVVTLSAAYGAGGPEVGPAVAERLGLPFHDRVIPVKVAGRLGVPVEEAQANDETVVTGLWRMVASLGAMPDTVGGVMPGAGIPDARAFREQTERVLTEIASPTGGGGVVLGRAAAIVLGDRPDVLNVRLAGGGNGAWRRRWPGTPSRPRSSAARWRPTTGRARPTSGTSTGPTRPRRGTTTW